MFGIVGGVAMLTLCINGTLSGPILRALGLAKLGDARQQIASRYHDMIRKRMFQILLVLLGQQRYANDVDFGVIKHHISFLQHLTEEEMKYAIKSHKETTPVLEYNEPNLTSLKPYIDDATYDEIVQISKADGWKRLKAVITLASFVQNKDSSAMYKNPADDVDCLDSDGNSIRTAARERMTELRKVFIELLQHGTSQMLSENV